jgi:hypothetical protein
LRVVFPEQFDHLVFCALKTKRIDRVIVVWLERNGKEASLNSCSGLAVVNQLIKSQTKPANRFCCTAVAHEHSIPRNLSACSFYSIN